MLVIGTQPKGKDNEGQMVWFAPGTDPTKPWDRHAVSATSIPNTFKLTAAALKEIADKNPEGGKEIADKLDSLKDKLFGSEKDLFDAASKSISKEDLDKYKDKIQKAALIPGRAIAGTFRFSHGLAATSMGMAEPTSSASAAGGNNRKR